VLPRCTFSFSSSHEATIRGSFAELDDVISVLLFEPFTRDFAGGRAKHQAGAAYRAPANAFVGRVVHGPIDAGQSFEDAG
jgi:hypothetical protein